MTNDLKQRVTDEQVEAAAKALHAARPRGAHTWAETPNAWRTSFRNDAHAALEAALSVSSSGEAVAWRRAHRDEPSAFFDVTTSEEIVAVWHHMGMVVEPLYAHPSPSSVQTTLPLDRETLGRMVREAWVRWALTQPSPKPSWLVPYDELSEPDKEADRQIGEAIAKWTVIHSEAASSVQTGVAVKALQDIAAATDADDPESYRSDDHEGCLDTVHAIAKGTLSALSSAPAPSVEELRGALEPFLACARELPDDRVLTEAHPEWERCLRRFKLKVDKLTVRHFRELIFALARNSDAAGEGK